MGVIWRMNRMLIHSVQVQGEALHSSPFYWVGVCPGRCQPVNVLHDTEGRVNSSITDTGYGKFTLVYGHQRELWQAWFIPGIFPRSHGGSSERMFPHIKSSARPFSWMYLRLLCSSAILSVLAFTTGSQCLFILIQLILAQSSRRRKTESAKHCSDSGKEVKSWCRWPGLVARHLNIQRFSWLSA